MHSMLHGPAGLGHIFFTPFAYVLIYINVLIRYKTFEYNILMKKYDTIYLNIMFMIASRISLCPQSRVCF